MNASQVYILISVVVLAIIAIVVISRRKERQKPLSKLAALAFAFIIAGIVFGEDRLIGYGLLGTGVILSIIDTVILKKKNKYGE